MSAELLAPVTEEEVSAFWNRNGCNMTWVRDGLVSFLAARRARLGEKPKRVRKRHETYVVRYVDTSPHSMTGRDVSYFAFGVGPGAPINFSSQKAAKRLSYEAAEAIAALTNGRPVRLIPRRGGT